MTATTPAAATALRTAALDIVFGDRPEAEPCGHCGRPVPPLPAARLELELEDESVLCLPCADKAHHGLRLILAVFNHVLEAEAAGDTQGATETLQGIVSALELTTDRTLTTPIPQPNRHDRRRTAKQRRRR